MNFYFLTHFFFYSVSNFEAANEMQIDQSVVFIILLDEWGKIYFANL